MGYVAVNRAVAQERAEAVIARIREFREQEQTRAVYRRMLRHAKWRWLPWWKLMSEEQTRKSLQNTDEFVRIRIHGWRDIEKCQEVLRLCQAARTNEEPNFRDHVFLDDEQIEAIGFQ